MTMTPTVVKNDADGFGWHGHLANITGLFDGKHLFLLEDGGEGRTKLVQREEFAGFLFTPLMKWMGMVYVWILNATSDSLSNLLAEAKSSFKLE